MSNIHQTSIVSSGAKIAESAVIGAFSIVESGVEIGENTVIEPNAHIYSGAKIGANCRICGFCTIAGEPQDLHFDSNLKTYVEIGDGTVVREGSTIHRATFEGAATKIGKNCLLMANSHVGHDCVLGDRVILASFSAVAGHVHVGDDTFISGGVMLHQKIQVGCGVIISGCSASSEDVPPYVIAYGRNNISGLNVVGLMRRKTPKAAIDELRKLYLFVYAGGSPRRNARQALESGMASTAEGKIFLQFFVDTEGGRPILRPRKIG